MASPAPIDLMAAVDRLEFLPDRTPTSSGAGIDWVADLAAYRDGAIAAVHYAGRSEWERHSAGDEIVMVIDGATTMTMLINGQESRYELGPMQLIVVPRGTWHMFDTPIGVKVVAVTPQPSDHQVERPSSG